MVLIKMSRASPMMPSAENCVSQLVTPRQIARLMQDAALRVVAFCGRAQA
jgi:hypothetical protein